MMVLHHRMRDSTLRQGIVSIPAIVFLNMNYLGEVKEMQ